MWLFCLVPFSCVPQKKEKKLEHNYIIIPFILRFFLSFFFSNSLLFPPEDSEGAVVELVVLMLCSRSEIAWRCAARAGACALNRRVKQGLF